MHKRFSVPVLSLLPLLACGGDSKGNKITVPDSGMKVFMDAPPAAACTASASYTPTFGSDAFYTNYGSGVLGSGAPHEEDFDGRLNADAMPDVLHLWLYNGYGGFGSGAVRPGTYTISAANMETDFYTCGVCAFIDTDLHMMGSGVAGTDTYFATGGSVTITSAGSNGSGTLSGSVSGLTFVHVTLDDNAGTTTPAADACPSAIASATFSGTLTAGTFAADLATVKLHHRYRQ